MSIFNMFKRKQKPLKEKPVPVAMNTAFGQFVIADPKKEMCYEGKINWGGEEVTVSLYCDSDKVFTANNALKHLYNIMKNREEWDRLLKQAIVDDLGDSNGMVEIWGDYTAKEIPAPVTAEEFCRRVSLGFMCIYPEGDFYFDYDLDEMFIDHGYGISANAFGEIEVDGLQG